MARTSTIAVPFSAQSVLALLLLCVLWGRPAPLAEAHPPQPHDPSSTDPGQAAAGSPGPPTALRLPGPARAPAQPAGFFARLGCTRFGSPGIFG